MNLAVETKDRVLIVDDDKLNQLIAIESLEGLSVLKAVSSGEEALALLDSFAPSLVLLDIMMPGINGYEVCKQIKAHPKLKYTKIILISGKAMIDEKIKGYEFGADDYITKPFVPDELYAKAKVFLRLSRMEQELDELNQDLDKKVQEKTHELYQTQALLMNASKMAALGEMAGGVAHEINNPLATIGVLGEQITQIIELDAEKWKPKVVEMAATISKSVTHIAGIINGLRTFSRDGSRDALKDTPLNQVLSSTLNLCQAKLEANQVSLKVDQVSDEVFIYCRPIQIAQVILNLISNSFDAVVDLPEKWIHIAVKSEKEGVTLRISDSGKGIPGNVRDKIFQPLFTTKEIGKGTGLGLSISKGIVDDHGGTLLLNTNSKNTEFVLFLPNHAPLRNKE